MSRVKAPHGQRVQGGAGSAKCQAKESRFCRPGGPECENVVCIKVCIGDHGVDTTITIIIIIVVIILIVVIVVVIIIIVVVIIIIIIIVVVNIIIIIIII
jgi:hypothetical protein